MFMVLSQVWIADPVPIVDQLQLHTIHQVLMRFQVVAMNLVRLTGPIVVTDRDTMLRDMKIRLIRGPEM